MKNVEKSSSAGTEVQQNTNTDVFSVSQPIAKPGVSSSAFVLTRDVTKKECPWLERMFKRNEIVFEYTGYTYGCISWEGKAFTEKENETPFFELPKDSVLRITRSVSVVHCKKSKYDVYIGRPSKWGNPFTNKAGTKAEFILPTRTEAIEAYRKWITEGEGKHLLKDLHELKGKTLGCWCKPQSCHGDVLAELVSLRCC